MPSYGPGRGAPHFRSSTSEFTQEDYPPPPRPVAQVKKRDGCLSQGCSILAIGFIILMVLGFLSNLLSEDDSTYSPPNTPAPRPGVVTPQPSTVEPTVTQPPDEELTATEPEEPTVKPQPPATEGGSVELLEVVQEIPVSIELLERHFIWEYLGEWNWDTLIPEALYEYYHSVPRPPTRNYSVYVTHPLDDVYIERVVEMIERAAEREGFDDYQTVELAIAFVQGLPYTVDSVTSPFDEYPRYPVETLVDGGGDCENTSILLASILSEMGYGVVLLALPEHMAIGVKGSGNRPGTYWTYEGERYFYIETTNSGWGIGELPEEYEDTSANIYPLIPAPVITHEWSVEGEGIYAVVKVKVNNLGTATAYNVSVFSGFDAGDGMVWSTKQSDLFNLERYEIQKYVEETFNYDLCQKLDDIRPQYRFNE
ncbi:MAG: hypothetical protein ABID54_07195, partial [Pseudomonadota bacterium]